MTHDEVMSEKSAVRIYATLQTSLDAISIPVLSRRSKLFADNILFHRVHSKLQLISGDSQSGKISNRYSD